jgi:hypothetical protein
MPKLTDFTYPATPTSMARYKGSTKTPSVERDYPNIVELIVPLKGFGNTLNKMQAWHQARELKQRQGCGRYAEPHWYSHWRFTDPRDAKEFQAAFGGELITPSPQG